MGLFDKLLCKHKWKSHSKKVYKWDETQVVQGTEHWRYPKTEIQEIEETVEVLICENCGKVKKIKY